MDQLTEDFEKSLFTNTKEAKIYGYEKNRFSYEEINEALGRLDEIYNNAIKQLEK